MAGETPGEPGTEDAVVAEEGRRDRIRAWVEANIGGHVTAVERLRRWRPVWRVVYEQGGAEKVLLVKSLRT